MKHIANALILETSPYLLQHAYNPVQWLPWGETAFEAARTRDLPILLSVGYSACHWCHVMERESFENDEIAALMNKLFIPVKVDREERPDVDSIYMNAVQILSGAGGWPMTVFLTPDGKPFYGGTYYPPTDRYGRPGFTRVLVSISEAWNNKRDQLLESANDLTNHLKNFEHLKVSQTIQANNTELALTNLERSFDPQYGGFGAAPKFPNPGNLEWLLEHHHRTGNPKALEMLEITLEKMANGGIYDHLGGGFARYSTDERWLAPHFEKMLYDNAQLIKLYTLTYQATGKIQYFLTAKESLEYLLREMQSPEGGFYSAQDADSEGVEGKYFVWSENEIDQILEADSKLFKRAFGITPQGNWEHHNILVKAASHAELYEINPDLEETLNNLEDSKSKLFFAREKRIKPGLDDKILCSWNGLTLEAFAIAGRNMGGRAPKYLQHAKNLAKFLLKKFSYHDHNGFMRLHHTYKTNTQAKITGMLEDYALLGLGMLEMYQSTFDTTYLETAQALTRTILKYFKDENGGFFDTPSDGETLIVRPKSYFDSAMPSGNGATSLLLLKLARLTSQDSLEQTALEAIMQMQEMSQRQPTGFGSLNRALEQHLAAHQEIAISGDLTREDTKAMIKQIHKKYQPHTAIAAGNASIPLLENRTSFEPRVFICQNMTCQQPIGTLEQLIKAL
jgi:uncharacterized protein